MTDDSESSARFMPISGNGNISGGGNDNTIVWGYRSDAGGVRDHNEDFVGVGVAGHGGAIARPLFVVADGLGGHALGEVASRTAVDTALASWAGERSTDPAKAVRAAVRAANAAVLEAASHPGRAGMGTTMTALVLTDREAVLGHVGDSRGYHLSGGSCTQVTTDHSRVAEMLRMRLISPAQASRHPARSQLTRSLGADPLVHVDLVRRRFEPGDCFVLCTDGMWDEVGGQDMSAVHAARPVDGDAARAIADDLVELALQRGSVDNVSVIVAIAQGTERGAGSSSRPDGRPRFRRGRR